MPTATTTTGATTEASIPAWGIRYLIFGDTAGLSEADRTAADRWAAGLDPRAEIVPEGRTYLSLRPAFGWHATDCRNCRIRLL
jgi:hypothetical protein